MDEWKFNKLFAELLYFQLAFDIDECLYNILKELKKKKNHVTQARFKEKAKRNEILKWMKYFVFKSKRYIFNALKGILSWILLLIF